MPNLPFQNEFRCHPPRGTDFILASSPNGATGCRAGPGFHCWASQTVPPASLPTHSLWHCRKQYKAIAAPYCHSEIRFLEPFPIRGDAGARRGMLTTKHLNGAKSEEFASEFRTISRSYRCVVVVKKDHDVECNHNSITN